MQPPHSVMLIQWRAVCRKPQSNQGPEPEHLSRSCLPRSHWRFACYFSPTFSRKSSQGDAGGRRAGGGVQTSRLCRDGPHVADQSDRLLRRCDRACCRAAAWHLTRDLFLVALASVFLLLARASSPHVAFLGRVPGTNSIRISPDTLTTKSCPTSSPFVLKPRCSTLTPTWSSQAVLQRLRAGNPSSVRLVICDLSASPHVDLAGSRMLHQLHDELAHHEIDLRIVAARGRVRDLLRADGIRQKSGRPRPARSPLNDLLGAREWCLIQLSDVEGGFIQIR